ncbi:MAG: hypothetical protein ACE5GE_15210, partial [Phycisphaerae bacterium]
SPKQAELDELRRRVSVLEADVSAEVTGQPWAPKGYYATYHILAGIILGLFAASASLLFNVVGSVMVGKHPLELIRVYLTFPMGESALELTSGFVLAAGCCLYLGTGMIGGIPFHLILSRYFAQAGFGKRFAVATVLGIGIWLVNFYGFLYWAQPMLLEDGQRWIVDRVPWYVAALTHLVFGWTMLMVDQWGRFVPHESTPVEGAAG